jgi:hypothetical protein
MSWLSKECLLSAPIQGHMHKKAFFGEIKLVGGHSPGYPRSKVHPTWFAPRTARRHLLVNQTSHYQGGCH